MDHLQLAKVEVARSGEPACAYRTHEMSFDDKGKFIESWKKQADGGWKCSVDTWNSDLPAAPPLSK